MQNYNNLTRTQLLYGSNEENEVGRQIKYLGGTRVLLHYSKNINNLNNLLDKIKRSLRLTGLDFVELSEDDTKTPKIDTIFKGIKICREENVDFVLAVGGINEFTIAKLIAVASPYDDNFYNIFKKEYDIEQAIPLGIVSTTICTGVAISDSASVAHRLSDGSLTFYSCSSEFLYPKFIIYSPELCLYDDMSLESNVVSIISLLLHRYFAKNKVSLLSDNITEAALKTVLLMYNKLKDKPGDLEGIYNLMWASITAYVVPFYSYSDDVSVDILSRAIVGVFDCSREQAESIILPAWFEFVQKKHAKKVAKLGSCVLNVALDYQNLETTSKNTVKLIKEMFTKFGLPTTLSQINGDAADIERILYKAGFPEIGNIGNYEKLDKTDCEVILSLAL